MESHSGRFGTAIINHMGQSDVSGHGGHGDDHAMIERDHTGKEFAGETEMSEDVEGENTVEGIIRSCEDGFGVGEAGVVDEDCWGAVG